jgi:hypothetical protein
MEEHQVASAQSSYPSRGDLKQIFAIKGNNNGPAVERFCPSTQRRLEWHETRHGKILISSASIRQTTHLKCIVLKIGRSDIDMIFASVRDGKSGVGHSSRLLTEQPMHLSYSRAYVRWPLSNNICSVVLISSS